MPYKTSFHSRFEKDVKAFKKNRPVRELIFQQVQAVIQNPNIGEPYVGNLLGLFKVSFGRSPEYRLLYRKYQCCQKMEGSNGCPIDDPEVSETECEGAIDFIFVKTREECNNLYKKEKAYFEATVIGDMPTGK